MRITFLIMSRFSFKITTHELVIVLFFNLCAVFALICWITAGDSSLPLRILENRHMEPKANACIIFLLRNSDLKTFVKTLHNVEMNFNFKHKYPYVLFNDEEFTDEFKTTTRNLTQATVEFGTIWKEHWNIPPGLNDTKIDESIETRGKDRAYRQMCRFLSGYFFKHPLTLKYEYYMRLDVDSEFVCPLVSDPFEALTKKHKQYGFVLATEESFATVETLWPTVKKWLNTSVGVNAAINNSMSFVSDDRGKTLSNRMCTFYNNFEVASFALFRNPTYIDYFNYLDKQGGFFYERWGDAPVHTYYVALMIPKTNVHLYEDIFYHHEPLTNHLHWDTECAYPQFVNQFTQCTTDWFYDFDVTFDMMKTNETKIQET